MFIINIIYQVDWKLRPHREKIYFHKFSNRKSDASSGEVGRKIVCTWGKVRGITYREIGLKASVVMAIRETFNWMCCYLNEGQGEEVT